MPIEIRFALLRAGEAVAGDDRRRSGDTHDGAKDGRVGRCVAPILHRSVWRRAACCVRARQPVAEVLRGFVGVAAVEGASARSARLACGRYRHASDPVETDDTSIEIRVVRQWTLRSDERLRPRCGEDELIALSELPIVRGTLQRDQAKRRTSACTMAARMDPSASIDKYFSAVRPSHGDARIRPQVFHSRTGNSMSDGRTTVLGLETS